MMHMMLVQLPQTSARASCSGDGQVCGVAFQGLVKLGLQVSPVNSGLERG